MICNFVRLAKFFYNYIHVWVTEKIPLCLRIAGKSSRVAYSFLTLVTAN